MAIPLEHQSAYNTLKRVITRFQGSFSLDLIRCNDTVLRYTILTTLEQEFNGQCVVLTLDPQTQSLHQSIITCLGEHQPRALIVIGLESITELDSLLTGANWKRDMIKGDVSCPLLLWITDTVLYKFNRVAPDLRSWAAPPISFLSN